MIIGSKLLTKNIHTNQKIMAQIANVDFDIDKELPMIKEWKSSRYFRKTVVQLRTEFRNDTESVIDVQNMCHSSRHPANGLGSIPGKSFR